MSVSIVQLLDWVVALINPFFRMFDSWMLTPSVSVLAFTVAAGMIAYFVGVLILRA